MKMTWHPGSIDPSVGAVVNAIIDAVEWHRAGIGEEEAFQIVLKCIREGEIKHHVFLCNVRSLPHGSRKDFLVDIFKEILCSLPSIKHKRKILKQFDREVDACFCH